MKQYTALNHAMISICWKGAVMVLTHRYCPFQLNSYSIWTKDLATPAVYSCWKTIMNDDITET